MSARGEVRGDPAIRAEISRPWIAVPVHIMEEKRLSIPARLTLMALLDRARRPNWTIRLYGEVLPALGIYRTRWPRIRSELERYGYYSQTRVGAREWDRVVRDVSLVTLPSLGLSSIDAPDSPPPGNRGVRSLTPQKSSAGIAGGIHKSNKHIFKSDSSSRHEASQTVAPQKRGRIIAGVMCWYDTEEARIHQLVAEHGEVTIAKAVQASRTDGWRVRVSRKGSNHILLSDIEAILNDRADTHAAAEANVAQQQAGELRQAAEQRRQAAHDAALALAAGAAGGKTNEDGFNAKERAIARLAAIGILLT